MVAPAPVAKAVVLSNRDTLLSRMVEPDADAFTAVALLVRTLSLTLIVLPVDAVYTAVTALFEMYDRLTLTNPLLAAITPYPRLPLIRTLSSDATAKPLVV